MGKRSAERHVQASKHVKFTDEGQNVIDADDSVHTVVPAVKPSPGDFEELQRIRRSLPIFEARDALIKAIGKAQVSIVVGETGSGKTTQLPQYLLESKLAGPGKAIACTQPRRVAAITVAQRVAQERGVQLGAKVGYSVRFDDKSSAATRIKFLTDGMLLREAIGNRKLSRYGIIILDEAHERTIHTDVLFALLKELAARRSDLKIVVMSATLEAQLFCDYFNTKSVLYVAGRTHPVEVMYMRKSPTDYIEATITTALQLHQSQPLEGDILIFLTGQEEIEAMERQLKDCNDQRPEDVPELMVCPMYGALPPQEQLKAFSPAPAGCRKVILATNIAETSITINGVRYVIDPGMVKQRAFNPRTGMDTLAVYPVSKAQAQQRCGRAGREAPGQCYRLYPEPTFEKLAQATEPEITRCNLSSVVLQLYALGIDDVINFDYISPPSEEALVAALKELHNLQALSDEGELTSLGKRMVDFPLDPKLARAMLATTRFPCLDELLSVVALLSVEGIFYVPNKARDKAHQAIGKFRAASGDHATYLNAFRQYKKMKSNRQWCYDHFINVRNMKTVQDIRDQLKDICKRTEVPPSTCNDDSEIYRKCLLTGFFANVAVLQPNQSYKVLASGQEALIHPSSCLAATRPKPQCILFNELIQTSKQYMRSCCILDQDWLVDVAPHYFSQQSAEA
eukprot:m.211780 g.211780  ORF g.211780 m.211780 type:complete len:683 (-) comp17156_c0_seq1:1776-3824(-)